MAYRRLLGRGIDADPAGAWQDFQVAAAGGDPYALFNLGYMTLRVSYGIAACTSRIMTGCRMSDPAEQYRT